jgi:hypothetical protein
MGIGPQVNLFGDELRTIIQLDPLRHPIVGHRPVERRDHIIALVAESCPDKGTNTANPHYSRKGWSSNFLVAWDEGI